MVSPSQLREVPKTILVIALRYLGDLLLTTPLFHSIRKAYPDCQLDVLVFQGSAEILEGNTDVDTIIQTPERKSVSEEIKLLLRLFRKYDVVFVTQTGDRSFFYALLAAPIRLAVVAPNKKWAWWKRRFAQYWTEFDDLDTHTILQNLVFAKLVGIAPRTKLVPPSLPAGPSILESTLEESRYAVLHMSPQRVYKRWTIDGWVAIGNFLRENQIRIVLSGSVAKEEIEYIRKIQVQLPADTITLAGKVSLAELAEITKQACLFIGLDTGVTHLASATGVPVVALFGPTNPVKWGPWPFNFSGEVNPFSR
jgi:heptosyltransferase-3